VVAEAAAGGRGRARIFAVKILGERGNAKDDLAAVAAALRDRSPQVRLAAVMAVRKLGPAGFQPLVDQLAREAEPNNRKMAVKTLQEWRLKEAVPHLVKLLHKERDKGVKRFCVVALEALTGKKLGDDQAAWYGYLERLRLQEEADRLRAERQKAPPAAAVETTAEEP
jgi:HEAT repeat protein